MRVKIMRRIRSYRNGFVPVPDIFIKSWNRFVLCMHKTNIPLDNKELRKLLAERMQALDDALWIKESLLEACVCKREIRYYGLFEVEG